DAGVAGADEGLRERAAGLDEREADEAVRVEGEHEQDGDAAHGFELGKERARLSEPDERLVARPDRRCGRLLTPRIAPRVDCRHGPITCGTHPARARAASG